MKEPVVLKADFTERFDAAMAEKRAILISTPCGFGKTTALLSPAELQVLRLICADKSNAEIADIQGIKVPTVKIHVRHILDKLNVSRRAEARTVARRLHLI